MSSEFRKGQKRIYQKFDVIAEVDSDPDQEFNESSFKVKWTAGLQVNKTIQNTLDNYVKT